MSDICGSQAAARSMQQLAREFSACRDMLVALGNENRQLIFAALLEHPGGVRVGDLAKLARLSRPATSHHPKVLQDLASSIIISRERRTSTTQALVSTVGRSLLA